MIIIIKEKDYKRIFIKILSATSLFIMFYLYYGHMSEKFQEQNNQLSNELNIQVQNVKNRVSDKMEAAIYKEAVLLVDMLNQRHIQSIKILKDNLFIICDYNTDIEPVLIRYGVNAFVKNTSTNIKIAINLKMIVENKYEV